MIERRPSITLQGDVQEFNRLGKECRRSGRPYIGEAFGLGEEFLDAPQAGTRGKDVARVLAGVHQRRADREA